MDLFEQMEGQPRNLLPCDGVVHYYGTIMSQALADAYFQNLMNHIAWEHDQAVIFGKTVTTKRKAAWYADHPYSYTYSKVTKHALPWTLTLLELRELIQEKSGEEYNSCLLNLYHDGNEGMAWHSDAEKDLKRDGAIASVSFGAERKFSLKHKTSDENVSQILQHGSLLVMKGTTQTNWLHSIPKTKTVHNPRVNLTFRYIVDQ
ncbi:alpha-ketoglutarate-dependent dioxygenase AlkB family protein [Curvivirga aplysinae]|uniref:alpha-ketoglutarate-dependent dioxygenase AlkB family protein n=1 Tax=Curvivirga aplysinae TaxID=2529852 RepID=UPI0012BC97A2|nr:alpha-ketoglutarate-dependent dioxygenase AlkB [Curvivirga aplysinae]MTI08315.1 alpha-ketoglutarate-dependent dioxygenase AlkB [Curvivirga aplysinae]